MPSPERPRLQLPTRTSRRRRLADKWATALVTGGGLAIVACILGILLFIVVEVWPLTRPASVDTVRGVEIGAGPAAALVVDEHRSHVTALDSDGVVRAFRIDTGEQVFESDLLPEAPSKTEAVAAPGATDRTTRLVAVKTAPGSSDLAAATDDGRIVLARALFPIAFEAGTRVTTPGIAPPVWLEVDPAGGSIDLFAARADDDGNATAAAQLTDGRIAVAILESSENMMTGERTESIARFERPVPYRLSALVLDSTLKNLYGATAGGEVLWWEIGPTGISEPDVVSAGPSAVTALSLLLGDRALLVGQEDGALSVWFKVRVSPDRNDFRLTRIRDFPSRPAAIREIDPSSRNKGFLALDESGGMGLYYSTSNRVLWSGKAPLQGAHALRYAPKADGVVLLGDGGRLVHAAIENQHPEVSWNALFGKVWYEGYTEPEFVWQSTGGTDDFESKLSLTPLLVGTLKGTIYSLILAIPLGVFGAMYASQFMHPKLLRYVKPTVEVMAALPSVVLGFLAGLWLAPRLEQYFPALLVSLVLLPVIVLLTGAAWNTLPKVVRGRFWMGTEAILFMVTIALGLWVSIGLSRPVEVALFDGNFQGWLTDVTGLAYDQRNAVVIGLAMGFAVIPIIFAISEDAFSNVPRNLVAGSLALGANRWQTVTRVVLPSASPGIFSAIMVGFGRAVGETMIVLMATGNTPIMSWNPFNGFRTLSANIAVEIPEAPHGGTLYRLLFLAALLLFVVTFVINTFAELVRQRLRKRYSEL